MRQEVVAASNQFDHLSIALASVPGLVHRTQSGKLGLLMELERPDSNHPPSGPPKGLTNSSYSRTCIWRPSQLGVCNSCNVAPKVGIVLQRLPRKRIVIVSNAEEATKSQHRVSDFAAHLVDHHPFDRTDALAVGAINGRPFDLVAADQIACFPFFVSHALPPLMIEGSTEGTLARSCEIHKVFSCDCRFGLNRPLLSSAHCRHVGRLPCGLAGPLTG